VSSTDSWRIQLGHGEIVELRGARPMRAARSPVEASRSSRRPIVLPAKLELGRAHYRRSELSWEDAGRPVANVELRQGGDRLDIDVRVLVSDRTFAPAGAINRYDNEAPDINGDSVQLYLRSGDSLSGWILIPENDSTSVRIRQLDGWRSPRAIDARWSPTPTGYDLHITLIGQAPDALDVIVNEKPADRERRRGQLVLSGASGEFVYLRGDRHDKDRLIPLRLDE
jgi:hypothetical protein